MVHRNGFLHNDSSPPSWNTFLPRETPAVGSGTQPWETLPQESAVRSGAQVRGLADPLGTLLSREAGRRGADTYLTEIDEHVTSQFMRGRMPETQVISPSSWGKSDDEGDQLKTVNDPFSSWVPSWSAPQKTNYPNLARRVGDGFRAVTRNNEKADATFLARGPYEQDLDKMSSHLWDTGKPQSSPTQYIASRLYNQDSAKTTLRDMAKPKSAHTEYAARRLSDQDSDRIPAFMRDMGEPLKNHVTKEQAKIPLVSCDIWHQKPELCTSERNQNPEVECPASSEGKPARAEIPHDMFRNFPWARGPTQPAYRAPEANPENCAEEDVALAWIRKAGAAFAQGFCSQQQSFGAQASFPRTEQCSCGAKRSASLHTSENWQNRERSQAGMDQTSVAEEMHSIFAPAGELQSLFTQLEQLERNFGAGVVSSRATSRSARKTALSSKSASRKTVSFYDELRNSAQSSSDDSKKHSPVQVMQGKPVSHESDAQLGQNHSSQEVSSGDVSDCSSRHRYAPTSLESVAAADRWFRREELARVAPAPVGGGEEIGSQVEIPVGNVPSDGEDALAFDAGATNDIPSFLPALLGSTIETVGTDTRRDLIDEDGAVAQVETELAEVDATRNLAQAQSVLAEDTAELWDTENRIYTQFDTASLAQTDPAVQTYTAPVDDGKDIAQAGEVTNVLAADFYNAENIPAIVCVSGVNTASQMESEVTAKFDRAYCKEDKSSDRWFSTFASGTESE